ncbi:hypothetical protein [Stenotrophomonas sp. TWI1151]|uniref:hypothetical protein n=1 Tax=Stenotrophomonas sp. TWI1151 TaxID=3136798 RepID=UPI003207B0B2
MTKYNTGNPVGSSSPLDLYDNAENLDAGINGPATTWLDRRGQTRKSWTGVEADFQQFLADGSTIEFPTWAAASAAAAANQIPLNRQVAVIGDSGTHVDPVSGLTVSNSGRYVRVAAGLEWRSADVLTQKADYSVVALTSGNVRGQAVPRAQAFNGAVLSQIGGLPSGFSIPAGTTGATTYIAADFPAQALRGKRIRVTQRYEATANWLSNTPLNLVQAQYLAGSASSNLGVSDYSIEQSGTLIVQKATLEVPANADRVGLVIQVASNAPSVGANRTLSLSEIGYSFVSAGDGIGSENDLALEMRLAPLQQEIQSGRAVAEEARLTSGDMLPGALPRVIVANGATAVADSTGRKIGLSIPAGETGRTSYLAADFDARAARGMTVRITQIYSATLGFIASTPLTGVRAQALIGAASSNLTVSNFTIAQSGNVITQSGEIEVPAGADRVGLVMQVGTTAAATGELRTAQLSGITYELPGSPTGGATSNDNMLDVRLRTLRADAGVYESSKMEVRPGTTYPTPAAANQAVQDRSATRRTTLLVAGGRYSSDFNWTLAPFATLKAQGAARPWIHYELPDGSTEAPANYQPFWVVQSGTLDGIKVTARNARYAVHCEASGANPDSKISVRDSWIEHFGNTLAGWVSQAAWGMGVSSGWDFRSEGTVYRSPFCAFSFHTNRDFTKPSYVENRNDRLIGTAVDGAVAGLAIRAQPLGSRQRDRHVLIGCEVVGDYFYNPSPWMPATLDYQPASHAEIEVSGYGNTPFVFRISDFGRALKVASAGGAGSSIAVSGTAAAVLFGDVSTFAGAANLPGYVHGSVDVSGAGVGPTNAVFITSLGKRLGDCSTVNKVLTVAVDGAAPLTVTFDQDYTNATNAAILAAINAVLGSAASATEYALGNRYRPNIRDEEKSLQNSSAVGIPMGSVLAYDGSYKRVRLMTAADAASLFAGIAWEDIYPSGWGRVKTSGYLPVSDIRRSDGAALVFGATMSVSATPGIAMLGGSQGLLRAIRADAIEVGR